MLVENPSAMASNNFQDPTVNGKLSEERKKGSNKHRCSREASISKVRVRSDAPVKQSLGGVSRGL